MNCLKSLHFPTVSILPALSLIRNPEYACPVSDPDLYPPLTYTYSPRNTGIQLPDKHQDQALFSYSNNPRTCGQAFWALAQPNQ